MQIYPAIDLYQNQCVRLVQGSFSAVTVYGDSPLQTAQTFAQDGATWLHMVDLSGAKDPTLRQKTSVDVIAKKSSLKVQIGGGVRSLEDVQELLSFGVERVIVGSALVNNPDLVAQWAREIGANKIVAALDVRFEHGEPVLATSGWQENSTTSLWHVLDILLPMGIVHALCTDIRRDGTLCGPSFALYSLIKQRYPSLLLQASGGVSSLDDLRQLKQTGVAGVIIGRALYEERFTLSEALAC